MAEKKTTSNSGLFGQSLGGDLDFSQFSGPKLFTPAPLTPASTNQIHNTTPGTSPAKLNAIPTAAATPPPPFGNVSLSGQTTKPSSPYFQPKPPSNSLSSQVFTSLGNQYVPSPLSSSQQPPLQGGLNNVPLQTPPPVGNGTMAPIPTFTPSNANTSNSFLTGPMVPRSSIPQAQTFTPVYQPQSQRSQLDETLNKTISSTPTMPPYPAELTNTMNQPYFTPQTTTVPQQEQPTQPIYSQIPDSPNEYNISPFASLSNQTGSNESMLQQTHKVTPHWFYLRKWIIQMPFYKVLSEWLPFSKADSHKLEHEFLLHRANMNITVQTDGGRYDVDLSKMTRRAVYWTEESTDVRRCSWFYKDENQFIPYEIELAEKLEEEYLKMMSTGIFNIRVDLSDSTFVLFHNPNVLVQYNTNQDMDWTGEDSKARPKVVRRGISEEDRAQIPPGEEEAVEHIVFVVHGIGPVADLRMRSIIECVDDLRKNSLHFTTNSGFAIKGRPVNRIEFFPIQWYSSVRDDKFGIDKQLESLSLPSISKLRNFTNETLTDILFFTSPVYCQAICDTVVDEMNRIYKLFKARNPSFNGKASICGHSLGSVISFDILANQGTQKGSINGTSELFEDCGEVVEEVIERSVASSRNSPLASGPQSLDSSFNDTIGSAHTIHDLLYKLKLLSLEKQFTEEQIDLDTLMMCQEGDLRDLGIPFGPRKKLMAHIKGTQRVASPQQSQSSTSLKGSTTTGFSNPLATRGTQTPTKVGNIGGMDLSSTDSTQFSYKTSNAGTGQPLVTYKQLDFETENLFALGSPIGLFLTCRGVSNIGLEYQLPKCGSFLNIFHPYDPVVYRLEPMINELIDIPPVLIPHHKGRKRFHLEIKENLSRVGAKVKSGFLDAVNRTWSSINDFAKSHQTDYQPTSVVEQNEKTQEKPDATVEEELARRAKEASLNFGRLNNGRRIDHVLQEKPFEILNEYLFALGSHACYWTSEDVSLLMLKQMYGIKE